MRRQPVRSSSIGSVGYDPKTHILEVEFANGRVYRYFEVSGETYRRLLRASSKGRFINFHVRDAFRFQRLN